MQTCFLIQDQQYCVNVPLGRFPFLPPIDVPVVPGKPDPTPWLRGGRVRASIAHDLSVLATVELLVGQVKSPKLRKQLGQALQHSVAALDVPEELQVSFGKHEPAREADIGA